MAGMIKSLPIFYAQGAVMGGISRAKPASG